MRIHVAYLIFVYMITVALFASCHACIADDLGSLVVEAVICQSRTLGHSWVVAAGACCMSYRAALGHSWVVAAGVVSRRDPIAM